MLSLVPKSKFASGISQVWRHPILQQGSLILPGVFFHWSCCHLEEALELMIFRMVVYGSYHSQGCWPHHWANGLGLGYLRQHWSSSTLGTISTTVYSDGKVAQAWLDHILPIGWQTYGLIQGPRRKHGQHSLPGLLTTKMPFIMPSALFILAGAFHK